MPQEGTNYCSAAYTWTFAETDQHDTGLRIGDLNGDGSADLFMINYHENNSTYEKHVWLNNGDGTGWTEDTNWNLPDAAFMEPSWHYNADGAELADINGDNLPDIIKAKRTGGGYSIGTYLNTGSGFVESTSTL